MNLKIAAILSSAVVSVVAIISTVLIVQSALAAGKNGAILMTGFTVIGIALGGVGGYNIKKVKEIKDKLAQAAGILKEPSHEPDTRNEE